MKKKTRKYNGCCISLGLCSSIARYCGYRDSPTSLPFYNLKNLLSPQRTFCEKGSSDVKGCLWNHLDKKVTLNIDELAQQGYITTNAQKRRVVICKDVNCTNTTINTC